MPEVSKKDVNNMQILLFTVCQHLGELSCYLIHTTAGKQNSFFGINGLIYCVCHLIKSLISRNLYDLELIEIRKMFINRKNKDIFQK